MDFVEPLTSPFGASALLRAKKDGTKRMVIDYRALNAITEKDKYPLPRIEDMLDSVAGASYFSKLDLTNGFHQIQIHPEDRYKTAFQCKYGSFQWKVMPFGVTGGPSTFQRAMNSVFRDMSDLLSCTSTT